jgi:RNA polymerase sigma factor (sigma-70 family)
LVWADDIAQDAFARLASADPGEVSSPRGFLFRVARNLAVDAVRRRDASPVRAVANVETVVGPGASPSPEAVLIAEEERLALLAALEALPERARLALMLRKVEGLSPEEIAGRLGVSPRQVQRLIAQAIAEVHAALRARDEDGSG